MLEQLEVTSVRIKLPFRLNHVNCFIAKGETGWTIIDTGINDATAHDTWKPIIENKEVNNIILSHYHPDHYGFAGRLQEMTGAQVSMTETDHKSATHFANNHKSSNLRNNYMECELPIEMVNALTNNETGFNQLVLPHPTIHGYIKEGSKIVFGKYEYEVVEAPGHSDGLVCFYNKEKSVLFSTDHILPKITPNISYHFYGEDNPLENYLQSLEKFKKFDAQYVIPSHGQPFQNANKRIDEILNHHHERLEKVLDILKIPSSVFQTFQQLFGKDFNTHDMRFAIGETISHLEYLVKKNECSKELYNGVYQYRV